MLSDYLPVIARHEKYLNFQTKSLNVNINVLLTLPSLRYSSCSLKYPADKNDVRSVQNHPQGSNPCPGKADLRCH